MRLAASVLLNLVGLLSSLSGVGALRQPLRLIRHRPQRKSVMAAMAESPPSPSTATGRRVIIVPGNGCSGNVANANWYGWLFEELKASEAFDEVVLRNMPDPMMARESKVRPWRPSVGTRLRSAAELYHGGPAASAVELYTTPRLHEASGYKPRARF